MTTSTTAPVRTLPPVWGPALRTVVSPRYGVFYVCANLVEGGFDAFPLDPTPALRDGLLALYAPDMTSIVEGVRSW